MMNELSEQLGISHSGNHFECLLKSCCFTVSVPKWSQTWKGFRSCKNMMEIQILIPVRSLRIYAGVMLCS